MARRAARGGPTGGKGGPGRKRHPLVDALGLVWAPAVRPAGVQDRDGAKALLARLPALPRLARVALPDLPLIGLSLPRLPLARLPLPLPRLPLPRL